MINKREIFDNRIKLFKLFSKLNRPFKKEIFLNDKIR